MRTLEQMRERVRRYLVDVDSQRWTDNTALDAYLEQAASSLWMDLVDPDIVGGAGRRALLAVSAPQTIDAGREGYPLPDDAIRMERIEVRFQQSMYATLTCVAGSADASVWAEVDDGEFAVVLDDRRYAVTGCDFSECTDMDDVAAVIQARVQAVTGGAYTVTWDTDSLVVSVYGAIQPLTAVPGGLGTDISGAAYTNGAAGTVAVSEAVNVWTPLPYADPAVAGSRSWARDGNGALFDVRSGSEPAAWSNDTAEGYVRMVPRPVTGGLYLYRTWYYHRPAFPAGPSGRLRFVPDGCDQCIEYLAAALMSMEELENDKPIGAFGQLYAASVKRLVGVSASGMAVPARRYVRMVQ